MNNRLHLPVALQRELNLSRTSGVQHLVSVSLGLSIVAAVALATMLMLMIIPHDLLPLKVVLAWKHVAL